VTEYEEMLRPPPAAAVSITYRDNLAEVRQFVRDNAARAGLPAARVGDLVIAVSELAANTLSHTDGSGTLHMWAASGELLCQVQDGGHLADPLAGRIRPPPDAGRGHGLWVVRQLSDALDITTGPGGTVIRLRMQLDNPDSPGSRALDAVSPVEPGC
jgi:anti-sigma regulatory factor (Ser/Thr protein kinase)